ncbi:DUF432 domain-containing protein [Planctomycetota bacterium]
MSLWAAQELESGQTYQASIGPLCLWVRRVEDEIQVAEQYTTELEAVTKAAHALQVFNEILPEDLNWSRWIVGAKARPLLLVPQLPNRGCVVRTESPLKIPPGQEATFFVSLPIWVELRLEGKPPLSLTEIPTVVRSNIWFGDAMAGELCYSLLSRARRLAEDADHPPHKAVCPVRIRNQAEDLLNMERFCVHVEHLNLYRGLHLLWTNQVTITFQGEDQVSKVDYHRQVPKMEPNLSLITPARTPLKDTLLKRSLGTFKALTDI